MGFSVGRLGCMIIYKKNRPHIQTGAEPIG
jgi:hypothetical protein